MADEARDWLRSERSNPPERLMRVLAHNGIVAPSEHDAIAPRHHLVRIPAALAEPNEEAPRGPGTAGVAANVAAAWIALRVRPLSVVVDRLRASRTAPRSEDMVPTKAIAAYHRRRRLVPIRKNCLLDSLALDAWLGEAGPRRTMVIGVTAEPFLAHCWLQTEATLLNDHYDHVRRYAPILIA